MKGKRNVSPLTVEIQLFRLVQQPVVKAQHLTRVAAFHVQQEKKLRVQQINAVGMMVRGQGCQLFARHSNAQHCCPHHMGTSLVVDKV
jgi:hypothetical protein